MNRRAFLKSSGAALGLLAVGKKTLASPTSAQADPLDPAAITPAMRSHRAQRLKYHNPDLLVDLGVGLWGWPLPMDYNGDGMMDLIVAGSGTPYNLASICSRTPEWWTQEKSSAGVQGRGPPGPRGGLRPGLLCRRPAGRDHAGQGLSGFCAQRTFLAQPGKIPAPSPGEIHGGDPKLNKAGIGGIRSSQWKYVDYYGTGRLDLVVGIDYWGDYNWQGAFHGTNESAFDPKGRWKFGPAATVL